MQQLDLCIFSTVKFLVHILFSLTVSHHPNQPWLAVGFTSLGTKGQNANFVSLFNYKTKGHNKPDIEVGIEPVVSFVLVIPYSSQKSESCDLYLAFTHDGE